MLDFRKWFLALAVVVLTAAVASAQPAFQCVANAGVPPIVRAEGVAELVGDIVLNCNNGVPTALGANVPQVNVQIFLNTNVTSRFLKDPWTDAILMIDEPGGTQPGAAPQWMCNSGSGVCPIAGTGTGVGVYAGGSTARSNMFQGRTNGVNSIVWLGVPIDPPGTTNTRIIRITNVRANANQLGTSSTLVPTSIVAFISMTGSTSVPINNPQQTVAFVQNGLSFSLRRTGGDSLQSTDNIFNQCASMNQLIYDSATNTDNSEKGVAVSRCANVRLRFAEGFASAFKTRYQGGATTYADQNVPGQIYGQSESGFMGTNTFAFPDLTGMSTNRGNLTALGSGAGQANQGTRLRAVFTNVPAGIRLFVTTAHTNQSGSSAAKLVSSSQDGTGPYSETPAVNKTQSTCVDNDGASWAAEKDFAEIPIFGGVGIAVWEVTAADPLAIGRVEFGVLVAYRAQPSVNLPGLGQVSVSGMFAPVPNSGNASDWPKASDIFPIPRFVDTSSPKRAFDIVACATNLLFPFVSNQAGFDTGLAIINTSKDPFKTENQTGPCTIYYYGDTNGAAAPPSQTSASIPAGDYLVWSLSSGGKFGVTATPGFQGYIIAKCMFQWAHGFAFISDIGAQRLSHGYLALVLGSGVVTGTRWTTSESLGQ